MKRYTYIHILSLLFLLTILFIESCEKPVRVLSIKTLDVPSEDITFENVVMKGELVDLGEDPIYNHGILIKPVSESDFIQMGEGETSNTGTFVTNFPNPTLGTNYEYKAFAETNNKVFYGELKSFISNNASIPAIKTNPFGDFTTTWVQSGGDITGDGGAPITARGVCWSTSSNPTTDDFSVEHASQGTGHFDLQINGLTPATEYFIKAFATNIAGTAYGNEVIFTTGWDVPSLETSGVTNITDVSCDVGGENIVENGQSINDKGVCWSTSPNPEITDSYLSSGATGTGGFLIFISTLIPDTEYYVRAYATNNMGTGYGNELSFTTPPPITGTFTDDRDAKVYGWVEIGAQVWMSENLAYLPTVWSGATLSSSVGYYYVYDYNGTDVSAAKSTGHFGTYGVLYNWTAAMNGEGQTNNSPSNIQGACPTGWHLPSDSEWKELEITIGMNPTDADGTLYRGTVEGGKLKSIGTSLWQFPNEGATDGLAFSGLPGGHLSSGGTFGSINQLGIYWSTTESTTSPGYIIYRQLGYDEAKIYKSWSDKDKGFSIRCVKD